MLTRVQLDLPTAIDAILRADAPQDYGGRVALLERQIRAMADEHQRLMEALVADRERMNTEGAVQISKATIDSSPIGATEAATVKATTLTFTDALVMEKVDVTYSANMTPDGTAGLLFLIQPTDAVAFTINVPSGILTNQIFAVRIINATAGALGAATWNGYKVTWTNPAAGNSRTAWFYYNSVNPIEIARTPADVPN